MSKLYEALKKPLLSGLVGLEVEVESKDLERDLPFQDQLTVWNKERDGSLRGDSAEYVLKEPLTVVRANAAIKELAEALDGIKVDWSFRTSVHVHVNVLDLTAQQLKNMIFLYLLFEDTFMNYCGAERVGNRFCLRLRDAEGSMKFLAKLFRSKKFEFPLKDEYRYSALNLDALSKFGSLEFRGMRGTIDRQVLITWIKAVTALKDSAIRFDNVNHIHDWFVETDDQAIIEELFPKSVCKAIMPDGFDVSRALADNYSLIYALTLYEKGVL